LSRLGEHVVSVGDSAHHNNATSPYTRLGHNDSNASFGNWAGRITFAMITDGTSNTLLLSEYLVATGTRPAVRDNAYNLSCHLPASRLTDPARKGIPARTPRP
jgi:hypothetical protein